MKKIFKDGKNTGIEIHDENDTIDVKNFGSNVLCFISLPLVLLTIYYIIKLWYCILICAVLWGLVCILLYKYYKRKNLSDESGWNYWEVFVLHGLFTALTFCFIVGRSGYRELFPLSYNMFGNSADTVNTIALIILVLALSLIFSGISASIFTKAQL